MDFCLNVEHEAETELRLKMQHFQAHTVVAISTSILGRNVILLLASRCFMPRNERLSVRDVRVL